MIIELMRISVPHAKKQEFGHALVSLIGPIQVQPGCLACGLSQTWPIGNDFQIEARWDNQGNLIRHLQSDIYKKLLLLMELSVTRPVVEFLTVLEFRGLDMVEEART